MLNPRNVRSSGRATALFASLTFSCSLLVRNRYRHHNKIKVMTLAADEFIRRFLLHALPDGFHRIRHYGLFANANRASNIASARRLLGVPDPTPSSRASDHTENGRNDEEWNACPCCGGRMIIIEICEPGCQPRLWPLPSIGLDSS
jgi:hypothetical protein